MKTLLNRRPCTSKVTKMVYWQWLKIRILILLQLKWNIGILKAMSSETWLTCAVNSGNELSVLFSGHIFAIGCTNTHTTVTPFQLKVTVGRPLTQTRTHTRQNSMSRPQGTVMCQIMCCLQHALLCERGYLVEAVHWSPPVAVRVQYFPAAVLKAHFLSSRLISNWKTSWSPSSSWLADKSMPRNWGRAMSVFICSDTWLKGP